MFALLSSRLQLLYSKSRAFSIHMLPFGDGAGWRFLKDEYQLSPGEGHVASVDSGCQPEDIPQGIKPALIWWTLRRD
jgi:hypothetical protein